MQAFIRVIPCTEDHHISSIFEAFFIHNYTKVSHNLKITLHNVPILQVYSVIGYNYLLGYFLFHVNLIFTFWWNYLDIFLAFVAMALSARFGQLNRYLSKHRWQVISDQIFWIFFYLLPQTRSVMFWRKAREEFNCLSRLTRNLDSAMGPMIALSFLTDVAFIC